MFWLFIVLITTAGDPAFSVSDAPAVMGPFKTSQECEAAAETATVVYGRIAPAPPGRGILVRTACEAIKTSGH